MREPQHIGDLLQRLEDDLVRNYVDEKPQDMEDEDRYREYSIKLEHALWVITWDSQHFLLVFRRVPRDPNYFPSEYELEFESKDEILEYGRKDLNKWERFGIEEVIDDWMECWRKVK